MTEHWRGYDPGDGPLRDEITELTAKLAEAEAEIEQLREELRLCIHVDKHIHITSGLNIEIERLRSQLAAMERGYKSYRDTAEEEFARLREALGE